MRRHVELGYLYFRADKSFMGTPKENTIRQQRLHVLFRFGVHQTKEDFDSVVPLFTSFRPHIYAPENALLLIKERQNFTRWLNREYEKASKDPLFRRQFIDIERPRGGGGIVSISHDKSGEFIIAESKFLIDMAQRPVVYPLDGMESTESSKCIELMGKYLDAMTVALQHFLGGSIIEATQHAMEAYRHMAASDQIREDSIVRNFPGFADEALTTFPRLARLEEVRALAWLGVQHMGVYERLQEAYGKGQNIILERSVDNNPSIKLPFGDQVQIRIKEGLAVSPELLYNSLRELTRR